MVTVGYKPSLPLPRRMPLAWLVERDVDSRNLVTLTYATTDGEQVFVRQTSAEMMRQRGSEATAGREVDADRFDEVSDRETKERYASEASRMAANHDPDDEV